MTVETVELNGQRFVILPERDFLDLQRRLGDAAPAVSPSPESRFRAVVPLELDGIAASELLIQDRR